MYDVMVVEVEFSSNDVDKECINYIPCLNTVKRYMAVLSGKPFMVLGCALGRRKRCKPSVEEHPNVISARGLMNCIKCLLAVRIN